MTLGAVGQGMVAGDLVNTAARLQSVAPPGTVLVGEATYRAASEAIAFEPAGEQRPQGQGSAGAGLARAARRRRASAGAAASDGLEPPFVGRDEELRLLKDLLHATGARAARRGSSRSIGLAGHRQEPPRLGVREVHRRPRRDRLLAPGSLARLRRGHHLLGARRDGPPAGRARRDRRRGDHARARIADDARGVRARRGGATLDRAARCSQLLGVDERRGGERDELFAAWRTFFERVAEQGPGRARLRGPPVGRHRACSTSSITSLEWSRGSPDPGLTLARPELLERRPDWGAGRRNFVVAVPRAADPTTDMREAARRARARVCPDATVARDRRARRRHPAVRRRDGPDAARTTAELEADRRHLPTSQRRAPARRPRNAPGAHRRAPRRPRRQPTGRCSRTPPCSGRPSASAPWPPSAVRSPMPSPPDLRLLGAP